MTLTLISKKKALKDSGSCSGKWRNYANFLLLLRQSTFVEKQMGSRSDEQCIMYCWTLKYAIQHVERSLNRMELYSVQQPATCWKTSTNRFRIWCHVTRWKDPTWRLHVRMKLAPKALLLLKRSWMRIHLAATTFQQVALSFNICCSTNVEPFIIDLSFFLLASGTFVLNTCRFPEEAYFSHLTWNPQRGYTISVKCLSRYLRLIISTVSTLFSVFLSSIRARR